MNEQFTFAYFMWMRGAISNDRPWLKAQQDMVSSMFDWSQFTAYDYAHDPGGQQVTSKLNRLEFDMLPIEYKRGAHAEGE